MNTKTCTKCKTSKNIELFNKYKRSKDGYFYQCKDCSIKRKYEYYHNGGYSEVMKTKQPTRLEYNRKYHHKNKVAIHARQKAWRIKNRKQISTRLHKYYKTNIQRNLAQRLRARIRDALKHSCKSKPTQQLVGCTQEHLKLHIESQFINGMSWEDYLCGKIHIDHKIPLSEFDLQDASQQQIAFHWLNLQPLWKHINIEKGISLVFDKEAIIQAIKEARCQTTVNPI